MDEKDRVMQNLMREVAKWKGRALEAAQKACDECEQVTSTCDKCRIRIIKESAQE